MNANDSPSPTPQNFEYLHQHAAELFELEARITLLAEYADKALEDCSPYRGLALFLADEAARVKDIAARYCDSY